MKLIRYEYPQSRHISPFDQLFELGAPAFGRFGSLFDEFFDAEGGDQRPAADLYEDDQNYYACIELPGVRKDRIDLELENAVLTVSSGQSKRGQILKSVTVFNVRSLYPMVLPWIVSQPPMRMASRP